MKKSVLWLIISLVCISLLISGCQVDSGDSQQFNNVADYSFQQGNKGWSYLFGTVSFQPTYMTYNEYMGSYASPYTSVTGAEWKPHQNEDIILRYEAQRSGKAIVKYSFELVGIQREGDDGVLFTVFGNDVNAALTEISLTGNGEESRATEELSVNLKKGDCLYFVLNAGYGSENDLTNVNVSVSF